MPNKKNENVLIPLFDPTLSWEYYINLENEFLEFLKYVPLEKDHYKVWSPFLGNMLNNTGSVIDSFLKTSLFSDTFNDIDEIQDARKRFESNIKLDMNIYRSVFEKKYDLSKKKIFDLKSYSPFLPFSAWEEQKSLNWWSDYTNYKHDQFTNRYKASLGTTLEALGALFLLNVIHLETRMILFRDGFIQSTAPLIGESVLQVIMNLEPFSSHHKIRAKSRLFGYVFETDKKISDTEKQALLSPWVMKTYRDPSPRLKSR